MANWADFFNLLGRKVHYIDVGKAKPEDAQKIIDGVKEQWLSVVKPPLDAEPLQDDVTTNRYCYCKGHVSGVILVYVDVGQLPPEKAGLFIDRLKSGHKLLLESLPDDVGVLYLPVRPGASTRVEYLPVKGERGV